MYDPIMFLVNYSYEIGYNVLVKLHIHSKVTKVHGELSHCHHTTYAYIYVQDIYSKCNCGKCTNVIYNMFISLNIFNACATLFHNKLLMFLISIKVLDYHKHNNMLLNRSYPSMYWFYNLICILSII